MVNWLSPLVLIDPITSKPGGPLEVGMDFAVRVKTESNDIVYVAPQGDFTDGASIPRFFWRFIGPPLAGRYRKAAVIHDSAYKGTLKLIQGGTNVKLNRTLSKVQADQLFELLMQDLDVEGWRRYLMYKAVSWFGGRNFKGTKSGS